ncbi:MAG: FAA hydrolase family protein [Actinobacteria bacterium]|nr:FAA hydrolase family protein [Actinomycetota bacterium]
MTYTLANIDGRAALVAGDQWYDLETVSGGESGPDPMMVLVAPDRLRALSSVLDQHESSGSVDAARFGPPVPRPRNVFAVGLNYQAHADEGSMEVPDNPLVFTKFPSCLVGPTADVEMRSDAVDYEGELVVVIGPGGKDIDPADAWDHVVGLMVGQDISDRPVQFAAKPPHFDLGKSFDTFGPVGPVMVSPDAVDRDRLRIITEVNGEVRQDCTTDQMIFDIPTLVSYLSRVTTLTTGDLIFTGTPEGIGATQGKFLADGDVITTRVEGIGTMNNRCVRIGDHRVC